MPALRRHARRLQACRTSTHHDNTFRPSGAGWSPVGLAFCAKLRIVNLGQRLAEMDLAPREIVVARRPNVVHAALLRLVRPVGVRDQRPRHPDEIPRTVNDRGLGFSRHRDAADRHHGLAAGCGPDLLVNVEERCTPEVHVRHVVFQAVGEVALAVGEIIERAVTDEAAGDARCLVRIDTTFDALVAGHLEADHEVLAAGRPDPVTNLFDKAHAIFQRTAVPVGALVRPR